MSADKKKSEIPVDATRALTLLYATMIDAGHTDHEILTTSETILRALRDHVATTAQTATQLAIGLAEEWSKKS